jgi:cytidylate kinase
MGSLLVVTGPPGAGKSTVARILVQRSSPSVLVEGDAFFGFLAAGGIDPWLPESHAQNTTVLEAAAAATGRFASAAYETVFDGVLGPWFLDAFTAASGLDHLDYVVLLPPADRCVVGVLSRTDHAFTDEAATRHMHAMFAGATVEPRHVLTDLPTDPVEVADRVTAARGAGNLRIMTS